MAREFPVNIPISADNLTGKGMKAAQGGLTRLEKKLRKINRIGKKFDKVGKSFDNAGKKMVAAGVVVGGALGVVTNQAAKYEHGFGRIATLMEGDASRAIQLFDKDIRALSIRSGKGLGVLQDALFDVISAGIPVGKSMQFLKKTTLAAVGGFAEVKTVVDGTTAILNAYEMSADKVLKITDQFSIANEVGKTTFERLSASVGKTAAGAAQMGVSSAEMLAALASVTKVTGNTEQAVTGFDALLALIAKPVQTSSAAEELERLNKSLSGKDKLIFSITEMKKVGFLEWFKKFTKATGKNAESINKLVGTEREASRFLKTLISQEKTFISTTERANVVTDKGEISMKNFTNASKLMSVRFAMMKARLSDIITTLGGSLFPLLDEFEPKITSIIGKVAEWGKENKTQVVGLVGGFGKVALALIGVGGISFALGIVTTGVSRLATAIKGVGIAMNILTKHPMILAFVAFAGVLAFSVKRLREMSKGQERLGKTNKKMQAFNKQSINKQANIAAGVSGKSEATSRVFNVGTSPKLSGEKRFKNKEEAIAHAREAGIFGKKEAESEPGFASDKITKAVSEMAKPQGESKTINIENLELPNVNNAEDFIVDMDNISLAPGVL